MKVLKIVLALVGLAGLVAAGFYLAFIWVDTERLLAAANANKSGNLLPSPMMNTYIAAGLGAAGGLLLGLGLGLPARTAGQVRREALDSAAARRTSEIGTRAAERTALPAAADGPVVDHRAPDPAAGGPVAHDPSASDHSASDHSASDHSASDHSASDHSASDHSNPPPPSGDTGPERGARP